MATVLVNEVVGTAWIRNADGSRTQIQQGMQIPENAEIITENGARVVLNADDAPALTIGENREFALAPEVFDTTLDAFGAVVDGTQPVDPDVARVLAALDGDGDIFEDLEATAAVLNAAGGDGAGGSSFTRLMSIIETTNPLALAYPRPGVDAPDPQILGGQARDAAALADAGDAALGDAALGGEGELDQGQLPGAPGTPVAPEVAPETPSTPSTPSIPSISIPSIPRVGLSITNPLVSEGDAATFIIQLSRPLDVTSDMSFTIVPGTAGFDDLWDEGIPAEGKEITVTVGDQDQTVTVDENGKFSVKVPPTVTEITVTLPTFNDEVFEGEEKFKLEVELTNTGTNSPSDTGEGTIVDDGREMPVDPNLPEDPDTNPIDPDNKANDDHPKLEIRDVHVSEGDKAIFDVFLSNPIAANSTLTLKINTEDSIKGIGFAGVDDLWESDNLGPVEIQTYDTEGNKLDIITVSPNADGEYIVIFPELTTNIQVIIPTHGDDVYEGPEIFVLEGVLSGTVGGVDFSDIKDTGTGTIVDDGSLVPTDPLDPNSPETPADDDRPTLSIANISVTEGDGSHAIFTVTLSNKSVEDVTFDLTLADGTATSTDYEGLEVSTDDGVTWGSATSATIAAGETELLVRTKILDDYVQESDETFTLTATITDGTVKNEDKIVSATGTIIDDDLLTVIVSDAGEVSEGSVASFTVNLENAVDNDTTMTLTLGHIHTNAADFDFSSSTVKLPNNVTASVNKNTDGTYSFTVPAGMSGDFIVNVQTQNDEIFEGPESFTLTAKISGQTAGNTEIKGSLEDTGTGTIVDDGRPVDPANPDGGKMDDDRPELTITDANVNEGVSAKFDVTLSNKVAGPSTVVLDITAGTAGFDDLWKSGERQEVRVNINGESRIFTVVNGQITVEVPAGVTGFEVVVPTWEDGVYEGEESFTLNGKLTGEVNGSTFKSTATGTGTIVDPIQPQLTITDPTVNEGSSAEFEIKINTPISEDTTLKLTLKPGSADFNDLWEDGTGTVDVKVGDTIYNDITVGSDGKFEVLVKAGDTEITVIVPTWDDSVFEGEESFKLDAELVGTVGGIGLKDVKATGTGTIVDTDNTTIGGDVPVLTVNDAGIVNEGMDAKFTVTLDKPVDNETTLTFTLGGGDISTDDIGTPTAIIGGQPSTVTQNPDGSYSVKVPEGATGIEITVPTVSDIDEEGAERFELEATLTGKTASGTDLPGDISDTGSAVIVDAKTDSVIEDGVGKKNDGSVDSDDPNRKYGGDLTTNGNLLGGSAAAVIIGVVDAQENTDGSWTVDSPYGKVTIGVDGSYFYELDVGAANGLPQGDVKAEEFTYTVQHTDSDGSVTSVEQKLTITIQGTNDAPVITDDSVLFGNVTEAGHDEVGNAINEGEKDKVATGKLVFSDIDSDGDQDWKWSLDKTEGEYGDIKLVDKGNGNWEWVYTLDNDREATQALGNNDKPTETFTVRITDKWGAFHEEKIIVEVQGTNDAPVVVGEDRLAVLEDSGETKGSLFENHKDATGGIWNPEGALVVTGFEIEGVDKSDIKFDEKIKIGEMGTLVLKTDGTYTFTPAENFSGKLPSIKFTAKEIDNNREEGHEVSSSLEITVTPVADAPGFDAMLDGNGNPRGAKTSEDVSVSLGLKAPVIKDAIDKSGFTAADGANDDDQDNPERLGAISLVFGPGFDSGDVLIVKDTNGVETVIYQKDGKFVHAQLNASTGDYETISSIDTSLFDYENNQYNSLSIVIADDPNYHVTGAEAGALSLTKEQFESIELLPKANDATNRTFGISATSFEVDKNGKPLEGIDGATTTEIVDVKVTAVTDPILLEISDTKDALDPIVLVEDQSKASRLNLKDYLKVSFPDTNGRGPDIDGSEERWFEISGLPAGSTVGGVTVEKDKPTVVKADGLSTSADNIPDLIVKFPNNYSGEINGVEVTLVAIDRDPDTSVNNNEDGERVTSTITLPTISIAPVAGDVSVKNVSTSEDTAIDFMKHLKVTDINEKGGSNEVITKIEFKIPDGWELDGDNVVTNDDGTVTLKGTGENWWKGYTLTPPAHSSQDATVKLSVTSTDTNENVTVGEKVSTVIKELDVKITVNPVAERLVQDEDGNWVTQDSDGDGTADLTMTNGHKYHASIIGKEDEGFALSIEGDNKFKLGDDWSNQDDSEKTFAILNPYLVDGQKIDGKDHPLLSSRAEAGNLQSLTESYFTYNDGTTNHTVTYNAAKGGYLIPMEYLDTVVFMPPKDIAGQFDIKVEAHTVDKDEDSDKVDTATSGEAWLEGIIIAPDADAASLATQGASGYEDTPIALDIRPSSTDKSETFNVKIVDIPAGATIDYGGQEYVIGADGTLTIENFNSETKLTITPPKDSNKDFTLKVEAQSVDKPWDDAPSGVEESVSGWTEQELVVKVKGVADGTDLEAKTLKSNEDGNQISLNDLVSNVVLKDTDGSETLTLRISGLPVGFNVTGANVTSMGSAGWVVDLGTETNSAAIEALLGAIKVSSPEHFSGKVTGSIAAVTTENDGHSKTVSTDIDFTVSASLDAKLVAGTSSINEDARDVIDFTNGFKSVDGKENLTGVYLTKKEVDAFNEKGLTLFIDGVDTKNIEPGTQGYYINVNDNIVTAQTSENKAHVHNDGVLTNLDFTFSDITYVVTQTSNDGTISTKLEGSKGSHAITVNPVTDEVNVTTKSKVVDLTAQKGSLDLTMTKGDADGKGADYDGSERFTQLVVEGVPYGVLVNSVTLANGDIVNAVMVGDGKWAVFIPDNTAASFKPENAEDGLGITLNVEAGAHTQAGEHKDITVTVVTKDTGADNTTSAKIKDIQFSTSQGSGVGGELPAFSVDMSKKESYQGKEDQLDGNGKPKRIQLNELINAKLQLGEGVSADANFSIVVRLPKTDFDGKDTGVIPPVSGVEGMTFTQIGADNVWVISGKGDSELQGLLESVSVYPNKDWNIGRDGNFPIDVTVNGYLSDGRSSSADITPDVSLEAVTDPLDIEITFAGIDENQNETESLEEGSDIAINISLKNSVDGQTTLGGTASLEITGGDYGDGRIYYLDDKGEKQYLTKNTETGLYDYVIPAADNAIAKEGSLDLKVFYEPTNDDENPEMYKGGKFGVEVIVTNKEAGSEESATSKGVADTTIEVVNNGYDLGEVTASGSENQGNEDVTKNRIQLDISGTGLVDKDGSESIHNALIKGLPEGFLVYVKNAAGEIVLAKNAGSDGDGNNSWSLGSVSGELPEYIAVEPPKNWSGKLPGMTVGEDGAAGLELVVISGEEGLTPTETSVGFDLEVTPVADGIESLQAAPAFGAEGEVIDLNLNITMKDGVKAGETDSSVETTTVTLKNLGEFAAFYVGGKLITSGVSYNKENDTYTIAGLSQAQANSLGLVQAAGVVDTKVKVNAFTVESGNKNKSDNFTKEDVEFELTIKAQKATDGADYLLYSGKEIDGGAGIDTIYLRHGENLDFSDAADKLKNIEVIDLTREGNGHKVSGLDFGAMQKMFGDEGNLTIKANGNDIIDLSSTTKDESGNDTFWRLSKVESTSEEDAVTSSSTYTLTTKSKTDPDKDDSEPVYTESGYTVTVKSPGAAVKTSSSLDLFDENDESLDIEEAILGFDFELSEELQGKIEAKDQSVIDKMTGEGDDDGESDNTITQEEDFDLILVDGDSFVPTEDAGESNNEDLVIEREKVETNDSAFVILGDTAIGFIDTALNTTPDLN